MRIITRFFYFVSLLLIVSCASNPYIVSNKKYKKQAKTFANTLKAQPVNNFTADSLKQPKYWVGTTNFGMRKPSYVILHHTAQNSCEQTLKTFTLERTEVSSHYVICKDGTVHHMLNDYLRAWHAGNSKWGNAVDINSSSIGIEIDNNGKDSFSLAQINSLEGLLAGLKKEFNIPAANFIGHLDIAPGRKVDPNPTFPWKTLADKGFGLWYDDTTNLIMPADFNSELALRIIGYNIEKIESARQSFRLHFLASEKKGDFDPEELKVLYAVMKKYL
ncbi:MAG: N-acetylmuramoyl-L-alanine amidase [Ferruginibacter sp.]